MSEENLRDLSNSIVPSEKDHLEYQKNVSKSDINNNNNDIINIDSRQQDGDEETEIGSSLDDYSGYTTAVQKKRRVEGKKAHGKKLSSPQGGGHWVQNKRWSYSQRSRDNRHMKNILSKFYLIHFYSE